MERSRQADKSAPLEKSPFASQASIRKQRDKVEELQNRRVKLVLVSTRESEDDLEAYKQSSTRHANFLETQRQMLEAVRDIYAQLPGHSYLDRLHKEALAHQTSLNMLQGQLAVVNQLRREAGLAEMNPGQLSAHIQSEYERLAEARHQAGQALFEQTGAVRYQFWLGDPHVEMMRRANPETTPRARYLQTDEDLAELDKNLPFIYGAGEPARMSFEEVRQRVAEFRSKLEKIRVEEKALQRQENQLNVERSSPRLKALDAQASDLEKQRKEVEARLGALQAPAAQAAAEQQDRNAVSIRLAQADYASYAVGANAGEQFVSQWQSTRKAVAEAGQHAAPLSAVPAAQRTEAQQRELEDLQVQALTHRVQLTEQLVKGEELLKQLHKDELNLIIQKNREYQRSLLTAGPGELLRKLAVHQMMGSHEWPDSSSP